MVEHRKPTLQKGSEWTQNVSRDVVVWSGKCPWLYVGEVSTLTDTDALTHTFIDTLCDSLLSGYHCRFPGPPSGISHYHLQRAGPLKVQICPLAGLLWLPTDGYI